MLKKTLHTTLLVFYLLFCTGLQEVMRLPVLIQHFFEHKSIDQTITFFDYLDHHYNDIPHTDDDEERDNQLPFKSQDIFSTNGASHGLPSTFGLIPKKVYQILPKQKVLINNDHIPHSAFAGRVWQPPKAMFS
jgi:hypothetical protein